VCLKLVNMVGRGSYRGEAVAVVVVDNLFKLIRCCFDCEHKLSPLWPSASALLLVLSSQSSFILSRSWYETYLSISYSSQWWPSLGTPAGDMPGPPRVVLFFLIITTPYSLLFFLVVIARYKYSYPTAQIFQAVV